MEINQQPQHEPHIVHELKEVNFYSELVSKKFQHPTMENTWKNKFNISTEK